MRKRMFKIFLVFMGLEFYSQYWKTDLIFHFYPSESNKEVIQECRDLRKGYYKPTFYLPTAFLQLLYGALVDPIPFIPLEREIVELEDKGCLGLDWSPINPKYINEDTNPQNMRICVIAHGITGGSETNYMRKAVIAAYEQGFRPVIIHQRGLNQTLIKTPQYHCAASHDDFRQAIEHIQEKYPQAKLYGMGISMGSNLLANYVATSRDKCKLKAFVSIANPYDILNCGKELTRYWKFLYNYSIINGMIKNFNNNFEQLKPALKGNYDNLDELYKQVQKSKTTLDYDKLVTIKLFNYKSVDDYYHSASCKYNLENITIPSLFINSLDDPICVKESIPIKEIENNPNLMLVLTQKGGHIDWFTSKKAKRWVYGPALQYLKFQDKKYCLLENFELSV